ncbi:MAG TPA: response regulator transcription factor [Blastocatellia bacterium]|nr:response regulator transcription factor [Blastocatellia bacterium]
MRLLIVEDNQQMRGLIRKLLADLAETITECDDGDEALEAYRRERPDWVLMDVEMKRMDGLTATAQIVAAFPDAKVVIVTKYDHARMRQAASRAGACGYVAKDNLMALRELLS